MKTAIVVFPGSNCDHDCYHAMEHVVGTPADLVWHKEGSLAGYDLIILPGGFSYGDYLRAGAIAHCSPVMNLVKEHAQRGGYVIGICNGFQVLTESRLLPGALVRNRSMKFICRDVSLKIESTSFVTDDIKKGEIITLPVAHMEGCYSADSDTLDLLESEERVIFRYCDIAGDITDESNINGSARSIAGILSQNRRVAGMMPHPERVCEDLLGGEDGLRLLRCAISMIDA